VIAVSKQFLPGLACGFDDPRINIHIADGNVYIREKTGVYDVIIVDSSDPIGPGEQLFGRQFYQQVKSALKPGGIVAAQGESFFLHKDCVENLMRITRELFMVSAYSSIMVPTYPGGHIGICMGSLGPQLDVPARSVPSLLQTQLKYYTSQIHAASFVLPYFVKKMFNAV
ncbi:MAG: spermidine synthase, partial [Proteobacteria bacterium]|nr:spermidine synthase [Pseudomonadota bacterium]